MAVSVAAAFIFALVLLPLPRFAGDRRGYLFTYHAPIAAVFVIYAFDRAERHRSIGLWQWVIEAAVVGVSLLRAVLSFPPVSGHALFLSYVLASTPFRLLWWVAAVVFAEVVYVKLVVLGDPTLISGIVGGVLAGVVMRMAGAVSQRRVGRSPRHKDRTTEHRAPARIGER